MFGNLDLVKPQPERLEDLSYQLMGAGWEDLTTEAKREIYSIALQEMQVSALTAIAQAAASGRKSW